MRKTRHGVLLFVALVSIGLAATALAQQPAAAPAVAAPVGTPATAPAEKQEPDSPQSFWDILWAGGPVGMLIMLLSVGTAALVIEHIMTIREPVLMPPGLGDEVRGLLSVGNLIGADQACRRKPGFLAFVVQAGLTEADGGWLAVEKAMEDATAEQSARLFRKIEYLSVIGNIAPMLGLLGTVIGMIFAFREVANTQGAARAADLAQGIYLALVTTVEGLIVAIPSLAAFAVFRNRVDQLVAETAYVAQHAFAPLKRNPAGNRPRGQMPPPVGGRP